MRFAWVLLAVALSACADGPTAPGGPVDTRVVLAPGQSATIAAAGIQVRFLGVIGDSRCPGDAICIQGGDAIVRLDLVASGGAIATRDLHTGDLKPIREGDLTIALENLSPYPFSSLPKISPGDYRATLRITR